MFKCKTIHLRYEMKPEHIEFLKKQSVLTIYAKWEGFLKDALTAYITKINTQKTNINEMHESYLAYHLDTLVDFKKPKTETKTIRKISMLLLQTLTHEPSVNISTRINTGSNANLEVANNNLNKLNLPKLSHSYSVPLNKLLLFRNRMAHGDSTIPITQEDINTFTILIQNMSADLVVSITSGYEQKVYLRSTPIIGVTRTPNSKHTVD